MLRTSNTNWNLYKSFLVAYETKNLTTASEILNLTRSAIGHNIRELGRQLDTKLFTPTPSKRGVEPTSSAITLYPLVKECFDKLEVAERSVQSFDKETPALIRLAVATSLASHQLAPYISKFCKEYPLVKLEFLRKEAVDLLNQKKIDIAITSKRQLQNRSFTVIDLFDDKLALIASRNIINHTENKAFTLDEIKKYPIIDRYEENVNNIKIFNIEVSPNYFAATSEQIYSMVRSGVGIGFYWDKAINGERLEKDSIVKLNVKNFNITETVSCAYNKSALTNAAKEFITGLVQYCKQFS
ncbi:MAG: LysR family transcriptional regulator [Christensenellaceae bacterium]|jgi:DNA-binding transcriptional LysR family regulator|nr:LysR family transcriptional regulator [Christensenellaceae bacterium]